MAHDASQMLGATRRRGVKGHPVFRSVALGVTVLCACVGLASTAAAAESVPPACSAGRTLFDRDSVRAFIVSIGPGHPEALVCVAGSSTPITLASPGPANQLLIGDFRVFGERLGFDYAVIGLGAGGGSDSVGWVDLKTGEVRTGFLAGSEHPNYDLRGYAVAPDGATAVIADTRCETVSVLPVRTHGLGTPAVVFTTTNGRLSPASLAISATTVTWRTVGGKPGSASRTAATQPKRANPGHC